MQEVHGVPTLTAYQTLMRRLFCLASRTGAQQRIFRVAKGTVIQAYCSTFLFRMQPLKQCIIRILQLLNA